MEREFSEGGYGNEGIVQAAVPSWNRQAIKSRKTKKRIRDQLRKLVNRLSRVYNIDRVSVAFFNPDQESLCVTHMLTGGAYKSSLTLTLPGGRSLLYQVLMQGYPIVDNYPELMTGNIIEKKILVTSATASVAVIPLIYDGAKLGVLSLGSPDQAAFGTYLEGVGEECVDDFVEKLVGILGREQSPAA